MQQRLLRSRYDRKIAGVCGGLATYFDIDPTIVRLIMLLLFFTGIGFVIYPILWLITPTEGVGTGPLPPPTSGTPPYVPPLNDQSNVGTSASGPFRFDPYTGQPISKQGEYHAYTGTTVKYDQEQQQIPAAEQPSMPMYVPTNRRGRRPMLGMFLLAIGLIAVANQFGLDDILTPVLLMALGVLLLMRRGRI